jgi:hypothetical protein
MVCPFSPDWVETNGMHVYIPAIEESTNNSKKRKQKENVLFKSGKIPKPKSKKSKKKKTNKKEKEEKESARSSPSSESEKEEEKSEESHDEDHNSEDV